MLKFLGSFDPKQMEQQQQHEQVTTPEDPALESDLMMMCLGREAALTYCCLQLGDLVAGRQTLAMSMALPFAEAFTDHQLMMRRHFDGGGWSFSIPNGRPPFPSALGSKRCVTYNGHFTILLCTVAARQRAKYMNVVDLTF